MKEWRTRDSITVIKVFRDGYWLSAFYDDKYKNYPINEVSDRIEAKQPVKNKGLEGVWLMKEGYWGAEHRFGEGIYKNTIVPKIFNCPMVVYAYYEPTTRQFQGGGGAMYQFDG